jgi:biotin operon repressor
MDQIEDTIKTPRTMDGGQWYWIPKSLIQRHAIGIGPIGLAVYNVLASMVDKQQECFPSQKYIADKLGYSRATVNKALKVLKDYGLIQVKKRNRYHLSYRLIEPRCEPLETEISTGRNRDVIPGNTNNNQIIRINNHIVRNERKLKTSAPSQAEEFQPQTREELLASDIAFGLKDFKNMFRFIDLAKKYPESLLRRVLTEAREIPDNKIKKSRTALFNYLLREYATKSHWHPENSFPA